MQISKGVEVTGRQTKITVGGSRVSFDMIKSAETVGREEPNAAEASRAKLMLSALQNGVSLSENHFIGTIWGLSKATAFCPTTVSAMLTPAIYFPSKRELNTSQSTAVSRILSNKVAERVVLIHGPPGTGKTTVIAAAVTSTIASSDDTRTLWLIAQSNVAVKNIAEKLANVEFWDFKIIVSENFHFDW